MVCKETRDVSVASSLARSIVKHDGGIGDINVVRLDISADDLDDDLDENDEDATNYGNQNSIPGSPRKDGLSLSSRLSRADTYDKEEDIEMICNKFIVIGWIKSFI